MISGSNTKQFLRLKKVLEIFPVSKNTFLQGIRSGRFNVTPIRNGRCVFYRLEEIEALLRNLSAQNGLQ